MAAAEEPLLGMPSNGNVPEEMELKNIQLHIPTARILSREGWSNVREVKVDTSRGAVTVSVQGGGKRNTLVTYHDLGMNSVSNFQTFFNYVDMRILMENTCVYHVNAPGQAEDAENLPEGYVYPTMDELAKQIEDVLKHFNVKHFTGLGVGFGANVLARYAFTHPDQVDALCLVNCVSTHAGWIEWGYQKMNIRNLRNANQLTPTALEYLLWHHFGKNQERRNHDLVQVYKQYFAKRMNHKNLSMLLETYITRSDLGLQRAGKTLTMPCLLVTGAYSPHLDDTVTLNSRLNASKTEWLKLSDCGMPLEEMPNKVSEALRLFLQGIGFMPSLSARKLSRSRSMDSGDPPPPIKEKEHGALHENPSPISETEEPPTLSLCT